MSHPPIPQKKFAHRFKRRKKFLDGEALLEWMLSVCEMRGDCLVPPFKQNAHASGSVLAHRLSFYLQNGQWPIVCMHKCDNPSCINPRHLVSGSPQENSDDCNNKGRTAKSWGVRTKHTKLSNGQVAEIRQLRADGWKRGQIRAKYGIAERTLTGILSGEYRARAWGASK